MSLVEFEKHKVVKSFTIAGLIHILGWLYILYSMYEAVKIYLKHKEK